MRTILLSLICTILCRQLPSANKDFRSEIILAANEADGTSAENGLFESDEVVNIKLSGSLRELLTDRGEKVQYHPVTLSYITKDSTEISIPAEAKTRGHFRKVAGNCLYPPLMLHFTKTDAFNTSIFIGQTKLKLVMPCQGDEYIIREWMVYRLYNLLTSKCFKARLVKVQLDDVKKKKIYNSFYGILLEEEQQMAKRNQSVLLDKKMIKPEQTEVKNFLTMAVFEYLIGNTDWSVQYQQNIKLLLQDSGAVPTTVPYDFDHAGLVNAPYAKPAEELQMYSVVDRRYRGYCVTDMKEFDEVISFYKKLKKDIYNLYANCPLLDTKYIKETKKYFDDFYETISNKKAMEKEFSYPCDKSGTGNVVIRGLSKH